MALSDQALSILSFAAYHQLESGDTVSEVVIDDGHGHQASADGTSELEQAGLLTIDGSRGKFTADGTDKLQAIVQAIRSAA